MPLQVMDASKIEDKGKDKGKLQDGCKEKSILDFFKTPEKEVTSKQKSLLQFFVKTSSSKTNGEVKDGINDVNKENKTGIKEKTVATEEENVNKKGRKKQVKRKLETEKKSKVKKHADKDEIQVKDVVNEEYSDNSLIIVDAEEIPDKDDNKKGKKDNSVEKTKGQETNDEHSKDSSCKNIENENESNPSVNTKELRNQEIIEDEKHGTNTVNDDVKANSQMANTKLSETETVSEKDNLGPKTSKRNNLKVQDMLNLLNEVQVIEKKEKKKKHKHKLHKHKSKDVIEVNGESPEESDIHKQINVDPADNVAKVSEGIEKEKVENGQVEKAGNKIELNEKCDNVKEEVKECRNKNKQTKGHKNEKEGTEQKNKPKGEENVNELDSKNSNEMSYTDFLAKLNSSQTEDEMDVEEQEDEIENNFGKIDDEDQGTANDGKLVKKESNNMITKFFSYTSTPGKDSLPVKKQKKKECVEDKTGEKKESKVNPKEKGLESDSVDKVNFLQSKASVSSKNSSQATLSFGVDGFKMTKQKENPNSDVVEKKCVKNGEIKEKSSIADKETNKADLNTSESVFATPVSKKTRKRKVASYLELSTDLDESDLADRSELDGCRRSSRKKYKVTVFQMDEERKTPIKIKLRRCAKSSSSANEDLEKSSEGKQLQKRKDKIKNNIKQTKAQALLEKAKSRIHGTKLLKSKKNKTKQTDKQIDKSKKEKGKKKRDKIEKGHKTDESDSDKSIARRSSRLEGKVRISMEDVSFDNIVILSDEDETEKSSKPGRKKKNKDVDGALKKSGLSDKAEKKKGTPVKQAKVGKPVKLGKGKSPVKKSGVKLAPMFMIGKKKAADSPVKPTLDPEQAKQRQLFLMSGVPDELKKQTAIRQANTLASSYPPIPTINHVQQVPENPNVDESQSKTIDVWKLQGVSLNLRDVVNNDSPVPQCNVGTLSTSVHETGNKQTDQMKLKKVVEKFDEATIDKCVNEISVSNPSYRVQEMFKAMKESKIQADADHNKTETQEMRTDMKGILSENLDLEPNKRKRPSLKLNKKDSMEVQEQDTKSSEESTQTGGSSLLWTDKYYPMKASEILGNSASLKKLKDWLLEWKQVLDREARKARKLLMKKNKGKLPSSKGTDWDEDSDFDMDSEDSEDDMSLCNTTLLVGPHGCGKTSSVYALAQELGFKVHEVNASSSRTGRQILSQLQEATQSHQVSSQGCHTPSKKKGHIEKPAEEAGPPPKSKMALAFTNLLNKQSTNDKDKNEPTEKKKKRGRPKKGVEEAPAEVKKDPSLKSIKNKKMAALISEESNSQSFAANSINLSTTTLILFEEVDLSFEEDKGFLQAVQTFMSSTKIPIILTSNKRHFSQSFDGRVEVINMKRPSVTSLTSHLQTIALTENIRTDFLKMSELVRLHDRDVRQCILTLQYLVSSGGTLDQSYKVLDDIGTKKTEITKHTGDHTVDNVANSGTIDKSDDDLDDFVVIKGRQNKRRRIVEDLDSNSGDSVGNRLTNTDVVERSGNLAEARKYPAVYGLGLKSILPGLVHCQKQSNTDCLIEILKECSGSSTLIDIYQTFYSITRSSLFYNNLHLLLPLSYTICDNIRQISMKDDGNKKKGKKRKRIQCDLYDSEGSDTETPAVSDTNKDSTIVDSEETSKPEEDSGKDKTSGTISACISRSLCSFASFYDTMSSVDVLRTSCDVKNRNRICTKSSVKSQTHLPPGLEDELCNFRSISDLDIESTNVLHSCIETRAFCKLFKSTCDVKDEMEKCEDMDSHFTESFTLPITPGMEEFQLSDSGTQCASTEQQRAMNDIRDNLPYTIHRNTRCIHTDYIPTLREICRGESLRLTANTKRRFHHYLDSITLPLRDKTMAVLTSTFT